MHLVTSFGAISLSPASPSNPRFASEQIEEETRDGNGQQDYGREAPPYILNARDKVHTEDTGHQRGEHENDAHTRHLFHGARHVVVDDAGVGFHCRVENVGVDIGGFACLVHLDGDVFDKVGVEFVDGQFEFEFRQERFVATNGGEEIGQAVLQARESHEVFVLDFAVEVAFGLFDEHVDLFESFQIPHGCREEEAEGEVDRVGEAEVAFLLIRHEINHHVGLIVTHGDAHPFVENDAKGYGGVWCA